MIHGGSGKLETVDHQEEANSENFVMGSDAAEFVDKVKDQVRNCVNLNAFIPGYSFSLCDSCGSSKWRRVFM